MKVLNNYQFTTSKARIDYQEAWFSGDTVQLTPKDFGEGSPKGKIQALRKYAKDNYGMKLRAEVHPNETDLVIKAYS